MRETRRPEAGPETNTPKRRSVFEGMSSQQATLTSIHQAAVASAAPAGWRITGDDATSLVLSEVAAERVAQDARFGQQNHPVTQGTTPDGRRALRHTFGIDAERCKMLNDDRAVVGKSSWDRILLEEVFEALALDAGL